MAADRKTTPRGYWCCVELQGRFSETCSRVPAYHPKRDSLANCVAEDQQKGKSFRGTKICWFGPRHISEAKQKALRCRERGATVRWSRYRLMDRPRPHSPTSSSSYVCVVDPLRLFAKPGPATFSSLIRSHLLSKNSINCTARQRKIHLA